MATLSQTKGTVKNTQGMMRHARLATTTDKYMQVVPEGQADDRLRARRTPQQPVARKSADNFACADWCAA